MSQAPSLSPGTLLAGKFRIERRLGAGAMGAVYAIDHELTHHRRALKLLHPNLCADPDLVRRFLNEASAAGRVGNPHLVETFDAGSLPTGEPYVVMELLEGEPLDVVLKRERFLDVGLAAEIVAQAAEGIDAAHGAGIIHRDLKPENLFVTSRDGAPFVKILDFGVSKFAALSKDKQRQTRAGMIYGSPAYMSPEQLWGSADVDARSDVFALGVVLFESVAGVLPFDGPTLEALALRVAAGDSQSLESLRPDLPPGLADVVRRALAAAREDRLATARALAEALAPFRKPVACPTAAQLGHAKTVASIPPLASNPPGASDPALAFHPTVASNPPGVAGSSVPPVLPRSRRPLLFAIAMLAVILVVPTTALLLRRFGSPAVATSPKLPPDSAQSGAAPIRPSQVTSAARAADSASPSAAPAAESASQTSKTGAALLGLPAPSLSARSRAPGARNLDGLSEDNPFR
jgi:serine/threonine protein kinase